MPWRAIRRLSRSAEITIDGKTKTRYEWTQEQRKIETAIRYQQDIATAAKASGDSVATREARRNISDLHSYYQKIADAAEVPERPERMGTYYGKVADGLKKDGVHDIIIWPGLEIKILPLKSRCLKIKARELIYGYE